MKDFIVEVRIKKVASNQFGQKSDMIFIERVELEAQNEKDVVQKMREKFKDEKIHAITVY